MTEPRDATQLLMQALDALEAAFPAPAGQWPRVVEFLRGWLHEHEPHVAAHEREELRDGVFLGAKTYVSGFEQLEVGQTFLGRYLVTSVLAEGGGEARVFTAKDRLLGGRQVVLKRIVIDPPPWVSHAAAALQDQTWLTEAKAQAAVPHRSVVPIHDAHRTAEGAVLSMQFVHAESNPELAAVTGLQVHLTPRQAVRACAELVHILQVAHARDITHGDVSPANVAILNADPQGRVPVLDRPKINLLDFGFGNLAHATRASNSGSKSQSQSVLNGDALARNIRGGTPGYMAWQRAVYTPVPDDGRPLTFTPEQLADRKQGDLFEAAATLHFWVTGETVWPQEWSFDTIFEHRFRPRNVIRQRRLRRVVDCALHSGYSGAEAFCADLWAWAEGEATSRDGFWSGHAIGAWKYRGFISTAVMVVMLTLALGSFRRANTLEARATASEVQLAAAEKGYAQLEERFSVAETQSATEYAEAVKRAEAAKASGDANAAALEQRIQEIIEGNVEASREDRARFDQALATVNASLIDAEEARKGLERRLADQTVALGRLKTDLHLLQKNSTEALEAADQEKKNLAQQLTLKTHQIERYEQDKREATMKSAEKKKPAADAGPDDTAPLDDAKLNVSGEGAEPEAGSR